MSTDSGTFILFFGLESNTALIYFVVQLLQLRPLAALQDDSRVPLTAPFPPPPFAKAFPYFLAPQDVISFTFSGIF